MTSIFVAEYIVHRTSTRDSRSLTPMQTQYTADAGIAQGGITTNYRPLSVSSQLSIILKHKHKCGRGPLIDLDTRTNVS